MKRPENGQMPLPLSANPAAAVAGAPILEHEDSALLADLQTRLHEALRALASGGIASPLGTLRGWRRARCHPVWQRKLAIVSEIVERIGGEARDRTPAETLADAARTIAHGYALLSPRIGLEPDAPVAVPLGTMARQAGTAPAAVQALRDYLGEHCRRDLRGAYLHGSFSTGDYTAYSDLDTLVVLRADVATSAERLLECAVHLIRSTRFLIRCDLLQHHGHFVLTEIDFDWYCDAYFPSALYPFSTRLLDDAGLGIRRVRADAGEADAQLQAMCARFLQVPPQANLRSAFHLKLYLSCFMILPALLLQVRAQPCYKRESFERVRPLYTPEEYRVMDEVSEMRRIWCQTAPGLWAQIGAWSPIARGALLQRRGRWGVPAAVFRRASEQAFQERLAAFATRTLELASAGRTTLAR